MNYIHIGYSKTLELDIYFNTSDNNLYFYCISKEDNIEKYEKTNINNFITYGFQYVEYTYPENIEEALEIFKDNVVIEVDEKLIKSIILLKEYEFLDNSFRKNLYFKFKKKIEELKIKKLKKK